MLPILQLVENPQNKKPVSTSKQNLNTPIRPSHFTK